MIAGTANRRNKPISKYVAFVAFCILVCCPVVSAESLSPDAQEAIQLAKSALAQENWTLAAKYLDDAQRLAPQKTLLLRYLGLAHAKANHNLISIAWFHAYHSATPEAADGDSVLSDINILKSVECAKISQVFDFAETTSMKLPENERNLSHKVVSNALAASAALPAIQSSNPSSEQKAWIALARDLSGHLWNTAMESAVQDATRADIVEIPMNISNVAVRMRSDLQKILDLEHLFSTPARPPASRPRVGSIEVVTDPVGAQVRIQNPTGLVDKAETAPRVGLGPAGRYTIIASLPGRMDALEIVELAPGEIRSVRLTLAPDPRIATSPPAPPILPPSLSGSGGVADISSSNLAAIHSGFDDPNFGQAMQIQDDFFSGFQPPPIFPVVIPPAFGAGIEPLVISLVEPAKKEIVLADIARGAEKDFAPMSWTLRGTGFAKGASLAEENEEAGITDGQRKSTLAGPEPNEGFTWMSDEFGFEVISSTEARLTMFRGVIKNNGLVGDYVEKDRFYIRNPDGSKSNVAEFSWIMHGEVLLKGGPFKVGPFVPLVEAVKLTSAGPSPLNLDMHGSKRGAFGGTAITLHGEGFRSGQKILSAVAGGSASELIVGQPFSEQKDLISDELPLGYVRRGTVNLVSPTEIRIEYSQFDVEWKDPVFSFSVKMENAFTVQSDQGSAGPVSVIIQINPDSGRDDGGSEGD